MASTPDDAGTALPGSQPPGRSAPPPARKRDVGQTIRTLATAMVAVLATVFLLSNAQTVTVDLIVTTVETPLAVVIAACLALGAILGVGAMGIRSRRRAKSAKARRR
jgi:uncharacterized integral membrane protein